MDEVKSETPKISIIEKLADKAVSGLLLLYTLFFSLAGILRYRFFDFNDFDLAIYSQISWNMLHGSMFSSILGVPFLANHTDIILFLILPIYFIIRTPILLLILQTLAVGLSGYLLYKFASNLLNKTWAFVLFVLYLIYPPLVYSNLYEFHPVVLALPFLFLSFFAYKDEKFPQFLLYSALAMLCKENIPLIIAMFGVLAFVDRKSIKWIATPLLLGMSFLFVLVFVIKPYFNRGVMDFFILYRDFGATPKEIVLNMISSPGKVMTRIFSIENLKFAVSLIGLAAFLPILSLKTLIPVMLVLLQHFLSGRLTEKTIIYHYTAKFVPFIFISAAYGLRRLFSIKYTKELGQFAAPFLLCLLLGISLGTNIAIGGPVFSILDKIPRIVKEKNANSINQKFIDAIPKEAAVVSTFKFLPKLSHRKELYSFHHIYMGTYTFSKMIYPLPERLNYALIDFNDEFTFNFKGINSYENLKRFFSSYNWQIADFDGSTVLFRNSERRDLSKLFQVLEEEPKIDTLVNGKINDEIELIGFSWSAGTNEKTWEVLYSFYWRCLKETDNDYNSFIALLNDAGELIREDKKYMCYRIYPTDQWQKGEIIREDYWYVFPSKLPATKYYLKFGIYDKNKKVVKIESDKDELFDRRGFLILLKI